MPACMAKEVNKMGNFFIRETLLPGVCIIDPEIFEDHRGYFMETYNKEGFGRIGIPACFVQDNQSLSRKGVLRGLHFQKRNPQGKLVRVLRGSIFDVAVDIRKGSETFGRWFGIELSWENKKQLYIPEGFAHGFLTLSDMAEVFYKCTALYTPGDEGGILWNDPDIGIKWPDQEVSDIVLSEKDKRNLRLKDQEADW